MFRTSKLHSHCDETLMSSASQVCLAHCDSLRTGILALTQSVVEARLWRCGLKLLVAEHCLREDVDVGTLIRDVAEISCLLQEFSLNSF